MFLGVYLFYSTFSYILFLRIVNTAISQLFSHKLPFKQRTADKFFEGREGFTWQGVNRHTSFPKDAWVSEVLHQY